MDSFPLLKNKFLLSMPSMADARFQKTIIFLANISDVGTQGFVFNKKISQVTLGSLAKELKFPISGEYANIPTFAGGPVEPNRGFVLHSSDYHSVGTQVLSSTISLTFHPQVLADIAADRGPKNFTIFLGHSGWVAGQLESEIAQNAWLQVSLPESFIFSKVTMSWEDAIKYCFPDSTSATFISKTGNA